MKLAVPGWARRFGSITVRFRWPVLVIGLLLTGGVLGYLIYPPIAQQHEVSSLDLSELPDGELTGEIPSIVGLSYETALLVLQDAGLAEIEVITTDQPAAGVPGRVVAQ